MRALLFVLSVSNLAASIVTVHLGGPPWLFGFTITASFWCALAAAIKRPRPSRDVEGGRP